LELSRNQAGAQTKLGQQLARGEKVKHGGFSDSGYLVCLYWWLSLSSLGVTDPSFILHGYHCHDVN
jgi:hypothetical protein